MSFTRIDHYEKEYAEDTMPFCFKATMSLTDRLCPLKSAG